MDIAEKVLRAKTDFDDVYEAGKKAEYDVLWDSLQNYGNRTDYTNAFTNWAGAKEITPKYIINTITLNSMFSMCLKLEKLPMITCANANGRFNNCYGVFSSCVQLTSVDFDVMNGATTSTSWTAAFHDCVNLKSIKKLGVLESQAFSSNTFNNCKALEDITIDGTIGQNGFDIHYSTKLTAKSLYSIVDALSTTKTGLTITLPTTAEANYNANPPENAPATWAELVATKSNWTIAYA